ncbi:MAG TPA: VTT domain-containing protein [Chthoniobacterales bacterium]|nr:VTT domain-containing protein [Chthoniobacterales bacterium]
MLALAFGIVLLSFVSEDAATISSSLSVLGGPLGWPFAYASCFLGIWLGDLGLYAAARVIGPPVLQRRFVRRLADETMVATLRADFARRGTTALIVCRFIPGTRLPTYLAAGLFAMPAARFALVTAVAALVWIAAIFGLTAVLGAQTLAWFSSFENQIAPIAITMCCVVGAVVALRVLAGGVDADFRDVATRQTSRRHRPRLQRWEFWPAWLFYLPVGFYYVWLALRYRSFTLPSAANPGIHTGGLIGESKLAILNGLSRSNPGLVADAHPVEGDTATDRLLALHRVCREEAITLPFIIKPDVGQRGNGVKLVRSMHDALEYFEQVTAPVIVQRYAPGPHEVGIFYYRFPGEERGRIFGITEKIFPEIVGDGIRTIERLIRSDKRASLIAETYLSRFDDRRDEILARGEVLKLVQTGNHAQGCIFREGAHLWTQELEDAIDCISRRLPGFYIGRYDIRYASEEDLKRGTDFQIVELNGASSEATNIYDARNSLVGAYRTLFEQWRLVFAIGAANRARGVRACSLVTLAREWLKYVRGARSYPQAD